MPLHDLGGHFCCSKPFLLPYLMKHSMNLLTWHTVLFLCGSWASSFDNADETSLGWATVCNAVILVVWWQMRI